MLDTALMLLLVPVCLALTVKLVFRRTIHWVEASALVGAGVLVIFGGLYAASAYKMRDTLVMNGEVTGKKYENVSCSHSYSCNCRTKSDGSQDCDTCYEHPYDRDWIVMTDIGDIEISRVDRRGMKEPSRWTGVVKGEPVSQEASYQNYIKASPYSLYAKTDTDKPAYPIPSYPSVFDYYRIQRVKTVGTVPGFASAEAWNAGLNDHLRRLGPSKQVNLNVIVTSFGPEYGTFLESAWLGGKKNDVTVVIGSKQWPVVDWVYAFTYAKSTGNEQLVIELREALKAPHSVDSPELATGDIARLVLRHFHRTPMENFKYLADEIAPSAVMIAWIISALAFVLSFLTYLFHKNSFDAGESLFTQSRRRRW